MTAGGPHTEDWSDIWLRSRSAISPSASAASRPSTTSASTSTPAASPASSARTAPARRPRCERCSGWCGRRRGQPRSTADAYDQLDHPSAARRRRARRRLVPSRSHGAQPSARPRLDRRPSGSLASTRCSTPSGSPSAADRRVKGYSMGMRQRLAIAAALLGDPPVLILDEPTNGLDPPGISWMRELLREQAAAGRAVLVSSHVLAEVAQSVDDVVVVADGELRAAGPLERRAWAVTTVPRPRSGRRSPSGSPVRSSASGHRVEHDGDVLLVHGAHPEQVGGSPARSASPCWASRPQTRSLEAAFFALTGAPGMSSAAAGRAAQAPHDTNLRRDRRQRGRCSRWC